MTISSLRFSMKPDTFCCIGKKALFLEGANGLDQVKEAETNEFAEQELISRKMFTLFSKQKSFSATSVKIVASRIGIAPGIVVGQLQQTFYWDI